MTDEDKKNLLKKYPLLKHFTYAHLPEHLQDISRPFCELGIDMAIIDGGPETAEGLRKLVEAKDCFVRAYIDSIADKIKKKKQEGVKD